MNEKKKIPERMCVSCRQMKPKNQLFRLVLTDSATVDLSGKINGRGVYLCKCKECIAKAAKNKNFAKINGFALDEELILQLENLLEQQN